MTIADDKSIVRLTREDLLSRVPGFVAEIASGAARREQEYELPFAAFARIRELGLGTLRVPVALGGPGGSASDYIGMIADIAVGDPNVAHALRSHFNYVENAILSAAADRHPDAIQRILAGKLFGGAHTEQGTARPGLVTVRPTSPGRRLPAEWAQMVCDRDGIRRLCVIQRRRR